MSLIDYIQQQTQIEKESLEALDAIFQVREYKKIQSLTQGRQSLTRSFLYRRRNCPPVLYQGRQGHYPCFLCRE